MSKYEHYKLDPKDGKTQWIYPKMTGYKLACCDCALVHEYDFEVVKVLENDGEGIYFEKIPQGEYAIRFKIVRNQRSTGQLRRNFKSGSGEASRTK